MLDKIFNLYEKTLSVFQACQGKWGMKSEKALF